jgi:hypothetical protein
MHDACVPLSDGRWLAFTPGASSVEATRRCPPMAAGSRTCRASRGEVYIEPFRSERNRVRVSVNGGGQPQWRRDGRELFFTTAASRLAAVDVRATGEQLDVSLPTELVEIRGLQGTGFDDYAPSVDGQRFLVKVPVEACRCSTS